ncbi:MAG: efflux RND transporter periplasmic adaptor subunit [Elusimicrobia bacterium]|nr:efflux RND transporter periplasmic adaptor subunit [Elusimicrobiota bacterium]
MKLRWTWMAIAASVLAGGGIWHLRHGKSSGQEPSSRTVVASLGRVEEAVEATGEVSPLNRVEIKPPIAGRIEKLLIEEGSAVEAGRILAWMSSSDRAAILDAARAKGPEELKRWEDSYKPTPIVAPLSGVVILRNVVIGQTVDAGAVLFAMADKLIVLAHVDEADIGRVKVGMRASINLDAFPDHPIDGRVSSILHEGKNVSNVITYGVKVEPRSVPAFFRSQMTANVRLIVRAKDQAILVPTAAVSEDRSGERRVFVPGPDGEPKPMPVKTGLESGDSVEIVEGLKEGDSVLIVRRRYVPQRGASSPLIGGGPQRGSQQGGGEGRNGGRQGRRS